MPVIQSSGVHFPWQTPSFVLPGLTEHFPTVPACCYCLVTPPKYINCVKLFNLTLNSITHVHVGTLTVKRGIKHGATQDCTYLTLGQYMYSTDDAQ